MNFTSGFHLCVDTATNGVVFRFPNKFCLSVRWGHANYCSNRMHSDNSLTCQNAEVAIIRPDGSIVNDVVGYVSPTDLLLWLTQTSNMKETN